MNGLFGPLREVSFTVRDIESEMLDRAFFVDRWHYIEHVNVTDVKYMGVSCQDLDISIAMAYDGRQQSELIQQRCDTPSLFQDVLSSGKQKACSSFWPSDYDAVYNTALANRCEEIWRGVSQLERFVYFRRQSGSIIKMAEITPERTRVLGAMRMDSFRSGSAVIRRGWPK